MTEFLQFHVLTSYPPSNPNRDDLGRPKTAQIGEKLRQRISSQAIKRALRKSEAFERALAGQMGDRTQRLGEVIVDHLTKRGVEAKQAQVIARDIAATFGKVEEKGDREKSVAEKNDKGANDLVRIKQLAFISPDERRAALALAEDAAAGKPLPKEKDLAKLLLRKADGAVDIAMFGRMLADAAEFNREAAVQVAHAFTTNAIEIEDDYYTAVDDLKTKAEDAGAGFVGEAGFGAGVYYLYICVDRDQLIANLDSDKALAARGLRALTEAIATASPTGKINSFANHVRPEFLLVERGDAQPRSLASAFTEAVKSPQQMKASIEGSGANSRRRKASRVVLSRLQAWSTASTLQAQVDLGHLDVPVRIVPCGCDASIRYRRS
jgi:CRISPR system Cascade subunit CasC